MTETVTKKGVGQRRVVEGLPWVQTDRVSEGTPIWKLDITEALGTYFVLKDYGHYSEPEGVPFSGIRLVSGGPFTSAGRWTKMDDAMVGVATYIKASIREKLGELRGEIATLESVLKDTEEMVA